MGVRVAGGDEGSYQGVIRRKHRAQQPRRQTVPWDQSSLNLFWVAACRSKCLSKPVVCRVLGQPVKLNARVASRSGALEAWDWTNGRPEHMACKILPCHRRCSMLASISKSSWTFNHCAPPWDACPVPVPARVHVRELVPVRLPVPVDEIREEPRPEAQRSSRRGPSPSCRRSKAASTEPRPGQVRPVRNQVSQGLRGAEGARRRAGRWAGARSTRASDGMRSSS